jgi:hypothetical protein
VHRYSPEFAAQTSSLTSLPLVGDGFWSIALHTISSILAACPLLRDLECQVSVITRAEMAVLNLRKSSVTKAVRSAAFDRTISPLRSSLQRLSLLQLRYNVPYDGTHMDLVNYTALLDLEVTSCYLMPPGPPCEERKLLHQLLPASLQRLKV